MATLYWHNLNTGNNANDRTNYSTDQAGTIAAGGGAMAADDIRTDGSGGTKDDNMTASAALAYGSFDLDAGYGGVFDDNGQVITIGLAGVAHLLIANTVSLLTSTGVWKQTETGNISNPAVTNRFYQLEMGFSGKTNTLTGDVRIKEKLTVGSGIVTNTIHNVDFLILTQNDFLVIDSGATITMDIRIYAANDVTQSAFECAGFTGSLKWLQTPATSKLSLTGTWNIPNSGGIEFIRGEIDFNDQNVTIGGTVQLGDADAVVGTLRCGDGIVNLVNIKKHTGSSGVLNLYFEGSTFNLSEDMNFTDIIVTPGTATIDLINTATKTITGDGQTVYNLVKSGVGITEIADNFNVNSLAPTAGTIRSDVADTLRVITCAVNALGSNTTFKDISVGSIGKVDAKIGGVNQGNNPGIIFEDLLMPSLLGFV
ncbi:hypothetical protein LCGC14_1721860 [marine sediment metagenome]|uniref:Uncharacterized protein n=1 Tax=marine sediment metagenome TaxID=412755 RepID=A0A0F9JSM3_9ZZZZ